MHAWLLWAGAIACAAGWIAHRMWSVLPWGRFGESLALAALVALLAWPLVRWRGMPWASALAAVWLIALVAMWGPLPVLAVALLLGAAAAIGTALTGPQRSLAGAVAGLAVIAGAVGWLLPLPVHRLWLYAPVLLALVAWRRQALWTQVGTLRQAWREAVAASPRAAAGAVTLAGLASAGAWLPTMQYDDVAYHLALPWQLMRDGRYALDPSPQVWALAAWASDALHGVAQVLARTEARGPLNVAWLLLSCAALWRLATAIGVTGAMRWAPIALFASLPLTAALQAGMQTETAATAATLWLAVLVSERPDARPQRCLWLGALLFGLLLGLKLVHAAAALPLLAWAAWRHRADFLRAPVALALAAPLAVVVAGSSYTYAWAVAGNPVLPLFNGTFRSPFFAPVDFDDARWRAGFDALLPWRMTFDTSQYLEGWDGGFGFVLIALAGSALLALSDRRSRALAACAIAAMAIPLAGLQYARYAYPGLVLLLPALALAVQARLSPRAGAWLLIAVCFVNLAHQGNAQWMLHTGAVKRSVGALGRDAPLLARYVPERVLIAQARAVGDANGRVLVLSASNPAYAELGTGGRTTAWYDPRWEAIRVAADGDASGAAWVAAWRANAIAALIVRPAELTPAQRSALALAGARRVRTVGEAEWWRLPAERAE
ncbi:hypothetical protein [Cognatilysobacter tabacisoli]|uniref:hypothetical protein n=1 Tax=Cognatilysobacter tabacisoli TaxID=2315424 RepID=UPI000E6B1B09|nr:hypothetical protein [Lysobacter tabacisoli]